MPVLRINTSEAVSLKPIPEDSYLMEVVEVGDVAEGEKSNYIPIKLSIVDGEHKGRTFYRNCPIDGKGAGIFIDFINKALDLDYDVDDMDELDFDTDELMGAEVMGNIKNEEYPKGSGELRSGVVGIARAGGNATSSEAAVAEA